MPKLYMIDRVRAAGGTLHLRILAVGGEQQMKEWIVRPVTFLIPSTTTQFVDNIFSSTFDFDLKGIVVEDEEGITSIEHIPCDVEITIKKTKAGKEVCSYKILKANAETAFDIPSQTPYQQVNGERKATEAINKEDVKSVAISLQGFAQAFIIQGMNYDDALASAEGAHKKLIARAKHIHDSEQSK